MRVFREENAERTRRSANPACRGVVKEQDVPLRAVFAYRCVAIVQGLPPHLFGAFQYQMDIDVLAMTLELSLFAAAPLHMLYYGKQVITSDRVMSRREREQICAAYIFERA